MAGTLITPTTSASPVVGGQITPTATTHGTITGQDILAGEYQLYRFEAIPAQGYTFHHFAFQVTTSYAGSSTTSYFDKPGTYDADAQSWVYAPSDYIDNHNYVAPMWIEYDTIFSDPYLQVTAMSVVAVFAPIVRTGLLIRNGAGTGLLRGDTVARPLVDA